MFAILPTLTMATAARDVARHLPNAHFVSITPGGRDASCTMRRHRTLQQGANVHRLVRYVCRYENALERLRPVHRHTRIRHDNLVRDPAACVPNIMAEPERAAATTLAQQGYTPGTARAENSA